MNKVTHSNRKQIWYPGAAACQDQKWIDYLKKKIEVLGYIQISMNFLQK